MPKRKSKKYSRPKKMFDKAIIIEENNLIKKYGLKNRREVWKANFAIETIRNIAKTLITSSEKDKNEFIERQREKGFPINSIQDVLALNKEDYLKRRFESIVVKKGLATTHKQARQFITHKHIRVNGNTMNIPSHLTTLSEEGNISLDLELPTKKVISDEERLILSKMKIGESK